MPLVRLLYRSDSDLTGSGRGVRDAAFKIADAASELNAATGVTGALMFTDDVFVQVLEGRRVAVEAVFERICRDLRHRRIVLLDFLPVEERVFADWNMVAFEGDRQVTKLFASLSEPSTCAPRNPLSASATVQTMRGLLDKRLSQAARPRVDRMTATDIGR